jgi:hypothetical protein
VRARTIQREIAVPRVRRKRQRLGPNGSIESDLAVNVRDGSVRPRAGSLPIESYGLSGGDTSGLVHVACPRLDRLCTISAQLFAEHQVTTGSHPSYRHEEPASPNTCITLLTGGLLVRIQPEESSLQSRTAIAILHNLADELYGSEPDGCARFSA